jgi:hypothetical protein
MTTATITESHVEPLGIVVSDGREEHSHPRIRMVYWANEEGTDEVEGRS